MDGEWSRLSSSSRGAGIDLVERPSMHERVAVVRGSVGEGLGVLGRWGARGGIVQMDREPGVGASFRSQTGHGGPSVATSGREHESNNGEPSRFSLAAFAPTEKLSCKQESPTARFVRPSRIFSCARAMTWASVVRVRMAPSTSSAARTLVDHRAARATLRARAATASSALGGARGAYGTEASSRCARRFCLHANANCSLFRRHSSLAGRVPSGCEGARAAFSFPAQLPPDVSPPTREPAASPGRGARASDIYPVRARCPHSGRTSEATRTPVGGLWTSQRGARLTCGDTTVREKASSPSPLFSMTAATCPFWMRGVSGFGRCVIPVRDHGVARNSVCSGVFPPPRHPVRTRHCAVSAGSH